MIGQFTYAYSGYLSFRLTKWKRKVSSRFSAVKSTNSTKDFLKSSTCKSNIRDNELCCFGSHGNLLFFLKMKFKFKVFRCQLSQKNHDRRPQRWRFLNQSDCSCCFSDSIFNICLSAQCPCSEKSDLINRFAFKIFEKAQSSAQLIKECVN